MDTIRRKFKVFENLDSSNSEAKRLALVNHPETWILTLKQSNGRGRGEKQWQSSLNNFTASLLFYPKVDENKLSMYSFLSGLAVYDAVVSLGVQPTNLSLKWPNDVLLNDKKLGGILLEAVSRGKSDQKALIIGFGLNLVSSPSLSSLKNSPLPAACLKNFVAEMPKPIDFLKILIPIFDQWNLVFLTEGFEKIREAFLERTINLGKKIKVKLPNESLIGYFSGLNDDGSLILIQ